MLTYKPAEAGDAALLSQTASTSKKMWGYDDALMQLWKEDLEVTPAYIGTNAVVKILLNDAFIGFYALKVCEDGCLEIDHLWLLPEHTRKGFGSLIFAQIRKDAAGCRLKTIAEPNAKGFYEKMGGKVLRSFESKVSGRWLEVMEFPH